MNERDLFLSALEIGDRAARKAHLQSACADDVELLSRVESLLASHEGESRFLQIPIVEQLGDDPTGQIAATIIVGTGSTQGEGASAAGKLEFSPHQERVKMSEEIPLGYLEPSSRPASLGRLAHYEILEVVGHGAFGTVLRAFDEKLQRVVAIKVMAPELAATSPARKRFLREAQASAAIRHENVVSVYAVEERPIPYLVMEYIPGLTLQQRLDERGPLDVATVLRLGMQIAEGLAAAHAKDLIHRDIKPGNILLETGMRDRVKITDFGLARAADDASMTQSGTIAGTPMYMAPEQALGHKLDQRADLFSFGSVLYQMASGRPPFRASSTLAVLKRLTEDTPRPIREIIPETPTWLCDIIAKLHAKNPDERYQSAREIADVLANCEAQIKSHAGLKDYSLIPRAKAQPAGWWKWAVVAALALPLLAIGLYAVTRPVSQPKVAKNENVEPATPGQGTKPGMPPSSTVVATPPTNTITNQFALKFDGVGSYIDVPKLRLDGLQEFTVETRVRLEKHKEKATILVGLGEPLFALDVEKTGSVVPYLMRERQPSYCIGAGVPDQAWHDLAVTVSGREVEVFVDGKHQATKSTPPSGLPNDLTPPRDRFLIGAGLAWDVPSTIYHFQGEISELRISRSVRYRSDYPSTAHLLNDEDTLALYHFDEGSGVELRDSSGHERHGKIFGAKWIKTSPLSLADIRDGAPSLAVAPFDAAQAKAHQEAWAKHLGVLTEYTNSIGMKFVLIPPGEFTMGSTTAETEAALQTVGEDKQWQMRIKSEGPPHKVILTSPVYLGVHEVTQADYERVMGTNPSHFAPQGTGKEAVAGVDTTRHPVEMVSWNDAAEFAERLSSLEKLKPFFAGVNATITPEERNGYRLPSEAEWEFACRAGTNTRYWIGDKDDDLALAGRFDANSGGRTYTVGLLKANPFGLYDTHGSVWEWVQDGWKADYYSQLQDKPAMDPRSPFTADSQHVLRGGNWSNTSFYCRSSIRYTGSPTHRDHTFGFRVAVTVDAVKQLEKKRLSGAGTISSAKPAPFPDAEVQRIAALPAAEQIEEFRKEMKRRNPDFDGTLTPTIENDVVTGMEYFTNNVEDISPVRAFSHLIALNCRADGAVTGKLADLRPLKGIQLHRLILSVNKVSDLTPLQGMPLTDLHIDNSLVSDLSPLRGMQLKVLNCSYSQISSLKPLEGMPLSILWCNNTEIADLTPVKRMPLEWITIQGTKVKDISPLKGMPITQIYLDYDSERDRDTLRSLTTLQKINDKPIEEFWNDNGKK